MLEKEELRGLQKLLLREKKKLEKEFGDKYLEFSESLTGSTQELSAYDNHPADLGSETYERGKDLGLQDAKRLVYGRIKDALDQIDRGQYGICELCGKEIPLERLKAVPYALSCVQCQEKLEGTTRSPVKSRRPVEEDILVKHLTDTGGADPGIDREDILQEVNKYGTAESPQDLGGGESYEELYTDEPRGTVAKVEKEQVEEQD